MTEARAPRVQAEHARRPEVVECAAGEVVRIVVAGHLAAALWAADAVAAGQACPVGVGARVAPVALARIVGAGGEGARDVGGGRGGLEAGAEGALVRVEQVPQRAVLVDEGEGAGLPGIRLTR